MADPARARRLAKRIATVVASAIEFEIKDPRLTGVTITDAKVTADLHDATLYYTVMGADLSTEPDYAGAAAALERARGALRTRVGAATGVRYTPTLAFVRDTVPEAAHRMEELLARARAADAEVQRAREGAVPAGDADPYRISGESRIPIDGNGSDDSATDARAFPGGAFDEVALDDIAGMPDRYPAPGWIAGADERR